MTVSRLCKSQFVIFCPQARLCMGQTCIFWKLGFEEEFWLENRGGWLGFWWEGWRPSIRGRFKLPSRSGGECLMNFSTPSLDSIATLERSLMEFCNDFLFVINLWLHHATFEHEWLNYYSMPHAMNLKINYIWFSCFHIFTMSILVSLLCWFVLAIALCESFNCMFDWRDDDWEIHHGRSHIGDGGWVRF